MLLKEAIIKTNKEVENLKEKTAKGLFWGFLNNSSSQVLNLVLGIFLARLLSPSDYGIVGILAIFTAVAVIFQNSGFLQGLINLKEPQSRDYNSVFWFNLGVSVFFYVLLFISAPWIALFFHQPCLVKVSRILFLILPIYAFGTTYGAYMMKNMMNREIAIIGVVSMTIAGIVAVVLAWRGFSYWSLVANQMVYAICYNIGRLFYVPWHPTLKWDIDPIKKMFGFSSKLLITQLFNTINQQLLILVIGRFFSIQSVGLYTQANKWSSMARSTISGAIGQITQPVLVSVSEKREREINVLRKLVRFTAFVVFPVLLGLALVANEFVILVLGEKWTECVPLLQILCIGGAFIPISEIYQNLLISNGRSDIYMWVNICQAIFLFVAIVCLYQFGIFVVVCVSSGYYILCLLVWQYICNRCVGGNIICFMKDVVPFACVSLIVMIITYLVTLSISNLWLCLVSRVVIASLAYVASMRLLQVKVMKECVEFFMKRIIPHD